MQPSSPFRSFIGDAVLMRGPTGNLCRPSIYVDGQKMVYDLDAGRSLSAAVPLRTVAAVEVYRRPAEIPQEYNMTRGDNEGMCGVLVFWTRQER